MPPSEVLGLASSPQEVCAPHSPAQVRERKPAPSHRGGPLAPATSLGRLTSGPLEPVSSQASRRLQVRDAEGDPATVPASTRSALLAGGIRPALLATVTAVWTLSPAKAPGAITPSSTPENPTPPWGRTSAPPWLCESLAGTPFQGRVRATGGHVGPGPTAGKLPGLRVSLFHPGETLTNRWLVSRQKGSVCQRRLASWWGGKAGGAGLPQLHPSDGSQ